MQNDHFSLMLHKKIHRCVFLFLLSRFFCFLRMFHLKESENCENAYECTQTMELILVGKSEQFAHLWGKSGLFLNDYVLHLFEAAIDLNKCLKVIQLPTLLHTCAPISEFQFTVLKLCISNVIYWMNLFVVQILRCQFFNNKKVRLI